MKLRNSLLTKYLLLIIVATMIIPFSFPVVSILFYMPVTKFDEDIPNKYQSGVELEETWHTKAKSLSGASPDKVNEAVEQFHRDYNKANFFWVDATGSTQLKIPQNLDLPDQWTPSYTIDFMKSSYDGDPFTIVAFIGKGKEEGFMVFQVPRAEMVSTGEKIRDKYNYFIILGFLVIFLGFIFMSWVFFYKIRKRLIRVQEAMTAETDSGIPQPIDVKKLDEIGQLETAFNHMIDQLETSRQREKQEEALRKQLIANLSHDLRTPLTTIRGHAYILQKESLSAKGQQSLQLIDQKINYLGELIENLLSYTLLSTGKYPYHPERLDIARIVRKSLSAWYPLFEKDGFEIELKLPDESIEWEADPQWLERILDNLFQNIHRYAQTGKYLGVQIIDGELMIWDRGPGMRANTTKKGTGIGLSIVSLMMKEMNLKWEMVSDNKGTVIRIKPKG
ncbi:HAMP domain-containing histidine kinase [Cytobacillus spongiae]|jgi:signal transduction histidine kinase|uniref:HAMP domain-containing sensor histidine kinase n=1 Tax=Cytobacillus spongiae TaxID=2901381 RepID=UPI001F266622|nr:HAMP domain-containing sensor histidine kinase [Cytobacillus spongiae]UII55821.1 HAMP domain-containing histidine kinase [Cytobacillus spongiae]